jgi:hypothetical protein
MAAKYALDRTEADKPLFSVVYISVLRLGGTVYGGIFWPIAVSATYAYTQKHHPGHWFKLE